MDQQTIPNTAPFDQHDVGIIAKQQLENVLRKGGDHLPALIAYGRRLCYARSALTHQKRASLYTIMMELRLSGVLVLPQRIMNYFMGRTLVYEEICRLVYDAVSK